MSSNIIRMESRLIIPGIRKKKVAVYTRVSSDKEAALGSLGNQSLAYVNQINANPEWDLVNIYEDRGISGTVELRPAFQQMLADCRAGKIDLIITKSFSRFARNTVVLLTVLRELKALGIEVIFENDYIRSFSAGGELLTTLLAAKAQAESFSASENQRWRIHKLFERGLLAGGVRMIGYRSERNRLVIIPDEVHIVREIYDDYISGMSQFAIAKNLNRMKVPTLCGGYWRSGTVRSILTNEKYRGNLLLQKSFTKDHLSKIRCNNHGERRQYSVKGSHDAIVSTETADMVHKEMLRRTRKTISKPIKHRGMFTGLLSCGQCGMRYHYRIVHSKTNYRKPVWICNTFNNLGKEYCNNQQIPDKILSSITTEILGTENLAEAVSEKIDRIIALEPGELAYILKCGNIKQVHWKNPSRSESWTPEMRQKAREKTLARYRKATT